MLVRKEEMKTYERENVRGGVGTLKFSDLLTESPPHCTMMSTVTFGPGESVGEHTHENNGELYYILEGTMIVNDDGVDYEMNVGDAHYCFSGHSHSARNETDKPATIFAIILDA